MTLDERPEIGKFNMEPTNQGHFFLESYKRKDQENKTFIVKKKVENGRRKAEKDLSVEEKVKRLHKATHHKKEEQLKFIGN